MESKLYNQDGREVGSITLPANIFGAKWNPDLVHQVVNSTLSSRRSGTAHTKNRGEVRGGGKKPWRQKGTGRARHGSIRSPLWVGGGVTHGPRNEKNYARTVSKKTKRAALYSVLAAKFRDHEILFVNFFAIPEIKTKEAKGILSSLSVVGGFEGLFKKRSNAACIAIAKKEPVVEKSFSNIGNVLVGEARNLNVLDILKYKYLIIANPEESLRQIIKA